MQLDSKILNYRKPILDSCTYSISVFFIPYIMDLVLNLSTFNIHSKLTLTRLQVILYRFEARLVTITEKMPERQDLIDETNENIRLISSAIEFQLENNTTFFKTQYENQKLKNDYLLKCAENDRLKLENEKLRTDKSYFG